MTLKHLCLYSLSLLLLVACRHKADDNTPKPVVPASTPSASDSTTPAPDTIHTPSTSIQKAVLQIDSAELTNLRLFGRKQKTFYNPTLLEGEWVLDKWHMQLDSTGQGTRWTSNGDIDRDHPDLFTWTMDSNLLYFEFKLNLGAIIPKMYVVTFVDHESLVYQNAYGTAYMWDRPTSNN